MRVTLLQSYFLYLLSADAVVQTSVTSPDPFAHSRQLLIGGADAPKDRFPYFISLQHYCGGALIAPDIILTAGHCKPSRHNSVQPAIGRYMYPPLASKSGHTLRKHEYDEPDVEYVDISKAERHPEWFDPGDDEFINDFSILILATPSNKPFVRINRNPLIPLPGESVLVLGAGKTRPESDSRSQFLQQVTLHAVSNAVCEKAVSIDRNLSYSGRIHSSHLCTGYGTDNTKDACDYDSGSPILIAGRDSSSSLLHEQMDLLIGLVSWGESCADPDFPGVNARVSDAAHWIDKIVCQYSTDPPTDFCCNHSCESSKLILYFFWTILIIVCTCLMSMQCKDLGKVLWTQYTDVAGRTERNKLIPMKSESSNSSSFSDSSGDEALYDDGGVSSDNHSYGSAGTVEVVDDHSTLAC